MYLEKKIFELKKDHKDIFYIDVGDEDFIFRPLTRSEYNDLVISPTLYEDYVAEKVCELCVLHPEGYDFYDPRYAGLPERLYDEIIAHSGFASQDFVQQLIEEYRNANQNRNRQIENTIIGVFPSISIDDIDDMNIYKLLDLYSRAEWIINNLREDLVHPEVVKAYREEQRKQAEAEQGHQMNIVNENADGIPEHWNIDPDKLKEAQQAQQDTPGMMQAKTLGGAKMDIPKRTPNNQNNNQQ